MTVIHLRPAPKLQPFEPTALLWFGAYEYGLTYTLCMENGEGYLAYRSVRGGKPEYRTEVARQTYAEARADMDQWFGEDLDAAGHGDAA